MYIETTQGEYNKSLLIIFQEETAMRVILDTDKKTITVPWNYSAKLEAINNNAAVGRKMGRSGSTVARYIKLNDTPKIVVHTFKEAVRN